MRSSETHTGSSAVASGEAAIDDAVIVMAQRKWRLVDRPLERAACLGVASDIFFVPDPDRERRARTVCRICEVREPCLVYALETDQRQGIWGGLNPVERAAVIRRLKASGGGV